MNETTVFVKDDNVGKVQMPRSHDTWVLLLVVSVLSTLLSVIVISTCLWICIKYCMHPSLFNKGRRQCVPNCNMTFPPPQREFVELEEFGARLNSFGDPRGVRKGFAKNNNNKTGASEQLGYRPIGNVPVPVLPAPRSWTPSPPFLQDNCHQTSRSQLLPGCSNISNRSTHHHHHCCSCVLQEECCRSRENVLTPTPCHLCPLELSEKLTSLRKSSREVQTSISRDFSEANESVYCPPVNTPVSLNKPTFNTLISQGFASSSEENYHRNFKRKLSNNEFGDTIKSLSHSALSRTKTTMESDNRRSNFNFSSLITNKTDKSNGANGSVVDSRISFISRAQDENQQENKNPVLLHSTSVPLPRDTNYNQRFALENAPDEKSIGKLTRKKRVAQRRKVNPIAVYIDSPSSESSSDINSVLTRASNTYWKLYHPQDEAKTRKDDEDEEEDGRYDATPSMSWDHLTPDPSPTHEVVQPKVQINATNTTALFYHEKKLEKDLACNVENIQPSNPIANGINT